MRTPDTGFDFAIPGVGPLPTGWRWAPTVFDPGPACDDDCLRRHARAHELAQRPHPDPQAERWLAADRALTRLLRGWFGRGEFLDVPCERWFPTGERVLRYPAEPLVLMEWMVLGYRPEPGAPTWGERLLPDARFHRPALESLTRAAVAAAPALLRVVSMNPLSSLALEQVAPPGPVVSVPDRTSACIAHVGALVGGRLLPTDGRWHLLRPVGPMVPPPRAQGLLRDLDRALESCAATRAEPDGLLRAHPEVLSDLLATYAL